MIPAMYTSERKITIDTFRVIEKLSSRVCLWRGLSLSAINNTCCQHSRIYSSHMITSRLLLLRKKCGAMRHSMTRWPIVVRFMGQSEIFRCPENPYSHLTHPAYVEYGHWIAQRAAPLLRARLYSPGSRTRMGRRNSKSG